MVVVGWVVVMVVPVVGFLGGSSGGCWLLIWV